MSLLTNLSILVDPSVADADLPALNNKAMSLSKQLQLPIVMEKKIGQWQFLLLAQGLMLQSPNKLLKPLFVDFLHGKMGYRLRHGGMGQALVKAVGLKPNQSLSIIDATAGLGSDGMILASLGASITLIEQSPIVAALLDDGLQRLFMATEDKSLQQRVSLLQGNAVDVLAKLHADVIYLDPMFPDKKQSALNSKNMQVLADLLDHDVDLDDQLLVAARKISNKVVVKRPKKAAFLGQAKPSYQLIGKANRFDVYYG